MKVVCTVEARMRSSRLPGKVLKEVNGKTLIEILFHRLSKSKKIDKIILATAENKENDILTETVEKLGFDVFRGSEEDVLDRYYHAAKPLKPSVVIRITGDCPIIDPQLVDDVIGLYQENNVDYVSNTEPPTYPDGLDTEVFSFTALETAYNKAEESFEREHVTPFICTNGEFKQANYLNETDLSGERWTVDDPEDFEVIKNVINHFAPDLYFSWRDVLKLKKSRPEYFEANRDIERNEGAELGTGQKLWKRAKKIIPGGNMLLSKRPEMFLPEQWPAYYSKAKGIEVWDLDGNQYMDMSHCSAGACVLGFSDQDVNSSSRSASRVSSRNCRYARPEGPRHSYPA